MSPQQSQSVLDLPKVIAVGIASPAATVLTSRFGIAGTLLGLALSAVLITVAVDFLKFYLARVPGAVTTIPGGLKKKSSLRKVLERMRLPFSKFASLPHPRRRSVLIGSVLAALISFLVGLIIVTALELGVGKSLSCWIWQECSTESSAASSSAGASTLPSVLGGGGQSAPSSTPQERPLNQDAPSNQQPDASPGTPGAPSQEAPPADPSAQPGQRQAPSGVPEKEDQQDQQQSPPGNAPADQQQSPPSGARESQLQGSVDQQQVSSDPL